MTARAPDAPAGDALAGEDLAREDLAGEDLPALLALLEGAAREAGAAALAHFREGARTTARVEMKAGGSPVTAADIAADRALRAALTGARPGFGWLSEESEDDPARLSRRLAFVVDPIDGTRAFVAGDPRWCVCAAVALDGAPVVGVVHAPALDETHAAALGRGATLNGAPLAVSGAPLAGARTAGPKPMIETVARAAPGGLAGQPRVPSLARRLVLVADGRLDLALVSHGAHDWDIAAAHLVLTEAGGALLDPRGAAPRYNRAESWHPWLVAAAPGTAEAARRALAR